MKYPLIINTPTGLYWDFNRAWARDMAEDIVREVFGLPKSYRFSESGNGYQLRTLLKGQENDGRKAETIR